MRIWRDKFFTTDINSPSLASWYTIPLSLTSTINFQLWDPLDILPPTPSFRPSCPITENIQVVRLFAPGFRPYCPLKEIFQVVRFFPSFSLFLYHKNPHGTLCKFKFMQVQCRVQNKNMIKATSWACYTVLEICFGSQNMCMYIIWYYHFLC